MEGCREAFARMLADRDGCCGRDFVANIVVAAELAADTVAADARPAAGIVTATGYG